GKVLAAIHVSPEAACGGAIAMLREGDVIAIDAEAGTMQALVDEAEWFVREPVRPDLAASAHGTGRELFAMMRRATPSAERGACALFADESFDDDEELSA
ncbi:MAG TPA: dihydroxy-acid dehydratase, partial [Xanthomonadaceae bacterium]